MKKIITSLGMIVFVGAVVVGGTGAFFSDTETSTGNVFTAGAIDLTVDSEQHYNNMVCVDDAWELAAGEVLENPQYPAEGSPCDGTWAATDLGAETFFNFDDVKPGDEGENTISLHVDNNDAYACVDVSLTANDDVSSTEPELEAGDTPNTGSLFDGELAQNINFFAWADNGDGGGIAGDNIWQAGEQPLFTNGVGPASDVLDGESYTIASPLIGSLPGGSTSYIGLAWCAGAMSTPVAGTIVCDGAGMGNDAQTDSMVANIAFRVEQARNNENFSCGDIPPADTDVAVHGTEVFSTTDKDEAFLAGNWFFYNDTNDTIMTINEFGGLSGENDIETGPGAFDSAKMVLHDAGARYNIATYQFKDTKLSDISSLKYRIYDASASAQTPYLHFNIDFFNTDTWQGRLVQVPTGVVVNTWTEVDALASTWTKTSGNWPAGAVSNGSITGGTARTWADILADYPNAETRGTDSFLGVRVGHPGPATEEGYVDWVEFDGIKYDFQN